MKDDINLQDKYGKTPLYTAVENKNPFLVKELYSQENIKLYEPDPMMANANGWTLMHAAVHAESKDMVELVVNLIGKGRSKLLLQVRVRGSRVEPLGTGDLLGVGVQQLHLVCVAHEPLRAWRAWRREWDTAFRRWTLLVGFLATRRILVSSCLIPPSHPCSHPTRRRRTRQEGDHFTLRPTSATR